jgi:hypothetical protein
MKNKSKTERMKGKNRNKIESKIITRVQTSDNQRNLIFKLLIL